MKIDNLKDSIIDRYTNKGESTVIIANDIGCSQGTVERLLKRNGIKMTPHRFNLKVNDENRAKIFALYQSGATTIEIGKEFNVSDYGSETLCRQLKDHLRRQIDLNDNKVSFSSGCYHVWWSGKKQLQDFYTYIYKDSAGLRLERKYNKFMAYC